MTALRCRDCGRTYNPNRGGHCRGCCRSFSGDVAFDRHRTGPYDARTCVDVTTAEGWRETSRGWTDGEPMTADVLARRVHARLADLDATPAPDGADVPPSPAPSGQAVLP